MPRKVSDSEDIMGTIPESVQPTSNTPSRSQSGSFRAPALYDETRDMAVLESWIDQFTDYLSISKVPDFEQVLVAGTYFTGSARLWYIRWKRAHTDVSQTSWEQLSKDLRKVFMPPNHQDRCLNRWHAISQGHGTVHQYNEEFHSLFLELPSLYEIDPFMICDKYIRGLNKDIQREVRMRQPKDLDSAQQMADQCESVFQTCTDYEKPNRKHNFVHSNQSNKSGNPQPNADLKSESAKKKPLTNAEKENRRKNNLCLYCGDSNHILDACPKKPVPRR